MNQIEPHLRHFNVENHLIISAKNLEKELYDRGLQTKDGHFGYLNGQLKVCIELYEKNEISPRLFEERLLNLADEFYKYCGTHNPFRI